MAIGAADVGMFGAAESKGPSRELTAIGPCERVAQFSSSDAEALTGKVVLVQFCTYTCINWLRTLPHVRTWAEEYGRDFVVLGVHTPEFAFEHIVDNVRRALQQMRIAYPVVIDNDYAIWRAFDNHYWPALYFVDARGRVRQHHFGEGEYEQSEKVIQRLLAEARARRAVRVPRVAGRQPSAAFEVRRSTRGQARERRRARVIFTQKTGAPGHERSDIPRT